MSDATGTKRPIRASMAMPPPTPKAAVSAEVKKLATTSRPATQGASPSGSRAASSSTDAGALRQASLLWVNWPATR